MQFSAFMSYAHSDDEHTRGRITELRDRLEGEVRLRTGLSKDEFQIFLDTDIKWGEAWRRCIDEAIEGTNLFIPFLTPTFLRRPQCRREVDLFLERETKLDRDDLILPVYYVGFEFAAEPTEGDEHRVLQAIRSHQYADWRDYRSEPFTNPSVLQELEKMVRGICSALRLVERSPADRDALSDVAERVAQSGSEGGEPRTADSAGPQSETATPAESSSTEKTEPPIIVVDALHQGDYPTIGEAITAAAAGTQILVRPGLYEEGLVIDKPLTIVGDGPREEIVVSATGANAVQFKTSMGRISNLSLRQNTADDGERYCVNIGQGRLDLEDCDITSLSLGCVAIHSGAEPILRRNRIHDGKHAGVRVSNNGGGILEENDIFGNAVAGVHVREGGNPTLRHNRIYNGEESGVYVYKNGRGVFEENEIFGNAHAGVEVKEGGNPTLRRNKVNDNGYQAVWIYKGGRGDFIENDLTGNKMGGWDIADDCLEHVTREGNLE